MADLSAFDPLHNPSILPPIGFRSRALELAEIANRAVADGFRVTRKTGAEMQAAENDAAAQRSAVASARGKKCRVRKRSAA